MLLAVALTTLVLLTSSSLSSNVGSIIELQPDHALQSQRGLYGIPQFFHVVGLQPASVYDIKVSYLATQPSLIVVHVERVLLPSTLINIDELNAIDRAQKKDLMAPTRRKLLTAPKFRLHPIKLKEHKSVQYRLESIDNAIEVEFSLLAEIEGVRRPDSVSETNEYLFDIVVEEVLLGVFPKHTLVLIGWLMILLYISKKWVLPFLEKKIALGFLKDRVEVEVTKES
ncbi:hypothetical protein CCR75_009005 [Bremia lactucae]|uniref:Signal sequence receptor subunit alpha n=1 Tax=Bremia lactucae TaxID=4779 RepID=A0A976IHA7_BRELC|nr:hypothetical protein CCR75_009005 [Bremia lactucae]